MDEENGILKKLNKNVEILLKTLERQNSTKRAFLVSIIQGVGSVVGATILAGVLLIIISKFIHSVGQIPLVGNLIKSTRVETSIDAKINIPK